jgi:hypothetical protein
MVFLIHIDGQAVGLGYAKGLKKANFTPKKVCITPTKSIKGLNNKL